MSSAHQRRENLRRRFRPARLRLLFIGEAPPASGRFFYQRDSGLYRAMRDTFLAVEPSLTDETFLGAFQAAGCYLIDLCPEPVDQLARAPRRAACVAAEPTLARTIVRFEPDMIATVVRSIEANVNRAAVRASWPGAFLHLPYPGRWSRYLGEFVRTLAPMIRSLKVDSS